MITRKIKPRWYHTPSGRTCKDQEEYDIVTKAWNKKYDKYYTERKLAKQQKAEQKRLIDIKNKKIKDLENQIKPLVLLQQARIKKRDSYISLKNKELLNQISESKTQMEKLRVTIAIQQKALRNFKKDSFQEFEKEFPFEQMKELKNLRTKLNKLKWG